MPKRKVFRIQNELMQRELGSKSYIGHEKKIKHSLYSAIEPEFSWHPKHLGGIFNLEFSPDGKVLVAACEKSMILGFDSSTREESFRVSGAHNDCVNGIKFLNSRVFASCSDDETIALWDLRRMDRSIRVLEGHSSWVKSLDYIPEEDVLISSGFDENLLAWDLKEEEPLKVVLRVNRLMRSKLTADHKKMLICTNSGFIIIIQNFNWKEFLLDYGHLDPMDPKHDTENEQNKLEYITDFPNYALQIHSMRTLPSGDFVVSRNITANDNSEYTCVHSLKPKVGLENLQPVDDFYTAGNVNSQHAGDFHPTTLNEINLGYPIDFPRLSRAVDYLRAFPGEFYQRTADNTLSMRSRPSKVPMKVIPIDTSPKDIAKSFNRKYKKPTSIIKDASRDPATELPFVQFGNDGPLSIEASADSKRPTFVQARPVFDYRKDVIYHAQPRLTNFIQEPHKGHGFIKEMCVSNDGRVIASPYGNGIRLMMFDEDVSEPTHDAQDGPKRLHTISTISGQSDIVLCSAFIPHGCQLVTGSYDSEIVWHCTGL